LDSDWVCGIHFIDGLEHCLERTGFMEGVPIGPEKMVCRDAYHQHSRNSGDNLYFRNRPQKGKSRDANVNVNQKARQRAFCKVACLRRQGVREWVKSKIFAFDGRLTLN